MPCLKSYVFSLQIRDHCPNLTPQPLRWLCSCILWAGFKKKEDEKQWLKCRPWVGSRKQLNTWDHSFVIALWRCGDCCTLLLLLSSQEDPLPDAVPRCRCQQGGKAQQPFPLSGHIWISYIHGETSPLEKPVGSLCICHMQKTRELRAWCDIMCVSLCLAAAFFFSLYITSPQVLHAGTS